MNTVTLTENQKTWLKHLDAIDKFDGTLKQYALAHNLVLQDIYSWKSQLRQKGVIARAPQSPRKSKPTFAKVQQSHGTSNFQFRLGNVSITSDAFPDPNWLATFVKGIGLSQ
mgnify:CR=1 FL=1